MSVIIIYFIIILISLVKNYRHAKGAIRASERFQPSSQSDGVSLIIPVAGVTDQSKECFMSWLTQDYPQLEVIFSLQNSEDPVRALLEQLKPQIRPFKILINPVRQDFSGKVSNQYFGLLAATHDFVISSDADIIAPQFTVQKLAAALEAGHDIVSCLPSHGKAENIWGKTVATQWNFSAFCFWGPAIAKGVADGINGATFAFKKASLNSIGGFEVLKNSIAEDLALGTIARKAGLKITLGPMVSSPVGIIPFQRFKDQLSRYALINLHVNSLGFAKVLGFNLFIFGYLLVLLYGLLTINVSVLMTCAVFILARNTLIGKINALGGEPFRFPWETVPGDFVAFAVFIKSIFIRSFAWGGIKYQVEADGSLKKLGSKSPS